MYETATLCLTDALDKLLVLVWMKIAMAVKTRSNQTLAND